MEFLGSSYFLGISSIGPPLSIPETPCRASSKILFHGIPDYSTQIYSGHKVAKDQNTKEVVFWNPVVKA